jgi:hypothetical protein
VSRLEFAIRFCTLVFAFSLIVYVIHADKPLVIIASMISIIVAALSGDWSRASTNTTIINNDPSASDETE